jgi:hypothetical protein
MSQEDKKCMDKPRRVKYVILTVRLKVKAGQSWHVALAAEFSTVTTHLPNVMK